MILNFLQLINFRKFSKKVFEFKKGINLIVGKNASGKTTILEAISMLFFPRNIRNAKNTEIIKKGETYAMVKGSGISLSGRFNLTLKIFENKKEIFLFDKNLSSYSYIFSKFPIIFFYSKKDAIFWNKREMWKEFNYIFSVLDEEYYKILLDYNRILKQRNKYLKKFEINNDPFKKILQEKGKMLQKKRIIYIEKMEKMIKNFMDITVNYIPSQLDAEFELEKIKGRTLFSISRDEIKFFKNGFDLKTQCSEGEKRMFLFFLYLCFANMMKENKRYPLLLFDDLFSVLRYELVRKYIRNWDGQVILTSLREIDDEFENIIYV